MYKNIFLSSLLVSILGFSQLLHAESTDESGYVTLSPVQPTQNPDKVEVIEFFWYGCPHCYSLEPAMDNWLKSKPDNVQFIRMPAIFSKLWGQHAKVYFTAEVLGVVDKVHADLFAVIQKNKNQLTTEDQLAKFFLAHGVEETDFRNAYNSFIVDTKMRQAKAMAPRYGITGVPAIVINGKYKTSGPLAKSEQGIIEVMNRLIEKESAEQ